MTATEPALVPDLVEIEVPTGARVLVTSDLHLAREATAASTAAASELAQRVESWTGPGVVILAGDCFELLEGRDTDPRPALQTHDRFTAALRQFAAAPGRRVVCLPGNHDGRLAWDARAVKSITGELGAEMALAVQLHITTGTGQREVRVEHGHQFDPANAFTDARNPLDSPIGHHLVREILPTLDAAPGGPGWLQGMETLDDPFAFPRFIASRLAYRRLGRHAWWLLLPFVLAVALHLPVIYTLTEHSDAGADAWSRRLILVGSAVVLNVFLMLVVVALAARRTWKALSGVALRDRGSNRNDRARDAARAIVTSGGAGLITGHTHRAELTQLGSGFYANTGCGTEVVDECPARFGSLGMPPVFVAHRELSWIELEAGAELHVRLLHSRVDLPDGTLLERMMARRIKEIDSHPVVVASFPHGESWPPAVDRGPALRRTRRIAASVIAAAGVLNLASAFYPPFMGRLETVTRLVPLAVPQAATALVALSGFALLVLARGIRRGHRLAWTAALVLLEVSALLHLLKGVDLEEAIAALLASVYLIVNRQAFRSRLDRPSIRRGISTLALGLALTTVVSVAMVELFTGRNGGSRLAIGDAFLAVVERFAGITNVALPDRMNDFLTPALTAVGIGLALFVVWLALRPVVARRLAGDTGLEKARSIVASYGRGTLDYFALRSDKRFYFFGSSLVAYAVYNTVCLVSPDPIGPESERDQVWDAFRRFADEHGWILAVMGAGEEWLPTYRTAGMLDLYVGDEAVVDVNRFSLEGGRNKSLRQAVNRIAKYGYTISFHDPATMPADERRGIQAIMTKSRRGDVERGFSMTLGRIFDPDDQGLLLAVAKDQQGTPVAFCQYVPAPGINGYSLDLMRRDDGEHPNGLLDFVVVETIQHLKAQGLRGLGLNFATMRAVLAGESGDSLTQRAERWLLKRMSGSMQIESLWRFNAKFDPDWQPRYAVYDAPEHALAAAIAVARAESFWELPIIGRFLKPDRADEDSAEPAEPLHHAGL